MHDPVETRVTEDISSVGWHVVKVLPTPELSGWAFTVGLWQSYGHPELVIFGLDSQTAHILLNDLGGRVSEGTRFSPDSENHDLLEDLTCHFRKVHRKWYEPFLGTALRHYGGEAFHTLQVFWPDKENRTPWNEAFAPSLKRHQPLLYTTDAREGHLSHWLQSL